MLRGKTPSLIFLAMSYLVVVHEDPDDDVTMMNNSSNILHQRNCEHFKIYTGRDDDKKNSNNDDDDDYIVGCWVVEIIMMKS